MIFLGHFSCIFCKSLRPCHGGLGLLSRHSLSRTEIYTEDKSIILADFNKESESKLFFCCLETFPPYFQPFLKTLVTDISESVSDGQHFPALYFFCKVYIFPLLSLKSSRTIISTDSLHFCSQKIAQQVSKQTNQYFSVSDGQKKSFHSDTYFVQCIRQTAHFCA